MSDDGCNSNTASRLLHAQAYLESMPILKTKCTSGSVTILSAKPHSQNLLPGDASLRLFATVTEPAIISSE